ncbi:MAG: hypothetical protein PHP82_02365 [Candidatus ainarchaeum sp.]|nr:hypothetical protein [Candidatus ainarchaeum sp.]
MAKPIEETPVLEGESAKEFWREMHKNKFDSKKQLELDKSKLIYKFFSSK